MLLEEGMLAGEIRKEARKRRDLYYRWVIKKEGPGKRRGEMRGVYDR